MKRLFEVLDEMNVHDTDNGTRLVSVSGAMVSADQDQRGTIVSMGTDVSFLDLESNKYIPLLILVDREDYFKRNPKE